MKRRLTGAIFQSLDGVVQAPGGPTEDPSGGFAHGGWLFGHPDPVIDPVLGELFGAPFALLLGRRTWDIFAGYWPNVEGEAAAMGALFTAADKYVLTRSKAPFDWANSHPLPDIHAVAALKATDGPDLLIQGSSTLYPPLLAAGLIDRLVVMTWPLLLGTGKRLFGEGTPALALRQTDQRVGASGVTVATYELAGPLASGNPPMPAEPSVAEQARQRAIAEDRW